MSEQWKYIFFSANSMNNWLLFIIINAMGCAKTPTWNAYSCQRIENRKKLHRPMLIQLQINFVLFLFFMVFLFCFVAQMKFDDFESIRFDRHRDTHTIGPLKISIFFAHDNGRIYYIFALTLCVLFFGLATNFLKMMLTFVVVAAAVVVSCHML